MKLIEFIRQFSIRINFKFLLVVNFVGFNGFQDSSSLCTCIYEIMTICWSYTPSPNEKVC
jgi:hypothetical protein